MNSYIGQGTSTSRQRDLPSLSSTLERLPQPLSISDLAARSADTSRQGHLVVLREPYLSRILDGTKTMESRFTKKRIAPFGRVEPGDVLFLKESAGPLRGMAIVSKVESLGPLGDDEVSRLFRTHQHALQLSPEWEKYKAHSNYATLISFSSVCRLETPLQIVKTDRRPWVVLPSHSKESKGQASLFENPNCVAGLHTYHRSDRFNKDGHPICKYCGADEIPWKKLHKRNLDEFDTLVSFLRSDEFRIQWWTKEFDEKALKHAKRKGLQNFFSAATSRLRSSIGNVYKMTDGQLKPYRDGYQTPYKGNVIYYAQHALACCCRPCLKCWHGIPTGRNLTAGEIQYLSELVQRYISIRLPELSTSI